MSLQDQKVQVSKTFYSKGVIILDKYTLKHKTKLDKIGDEVIISLDAYKVDEKKFNIIVGFYSTNLEVMEYDITKDTLIKVKTIHNACSELKVGISSISSLDYTKKDYISGTINDISLVCTGSYDCRVRLYLKTDWSYLGSIKFQPSIIHQVNFYIHKDSDSLYLFIASEQKIFYIYLVA